MTGSTRSDAPSRARSLGLEVTAMLLDIDYILIGMPGIALSLWAQWRIVLGLLGRRRGFRRRRA